MASAASDNEKPMFVGTNKTKASYSSTEPKWKQAVDNKMHLLTTKEKAAENGLQFLKAVVSILAEHKQGSLSIISEIWTEKIEALLRDEKLSPILIGLYGGTGAGKTSLINAILRIPGLLPVSSFKACTAVVVQVAYNRSDDPTALYRAEVEFVTQDEWQKDLEVQFRDVEAHFADSDLVDFQKDLSYDDRLDRIKNSLATLKVVYPHLKSIDDLHATSAFKLVQDAKDRGLLGSTKSIQNAKQKVFSKAIRPFIAAGESADVDFWPLIKCVKVFVKAQILESGIVLVDLPGNMDRNSSRGSVAMHYLKNLTAPMIVAPAMRGIDDQNAHLILEDVMKTDLQMDGIYTRGNLCFVLSQFDRDFDAKDYLDNNSALEQRLRPLLDDVETQRKTISVRKRQRSEIKKSRRARLASITNPKSQIGQSSLKRKRATRCSDSNSRDLPSRLPGENVDLLAEDDRQIKGLDRGISHLESKVCSLLSQIISACNDDRKMKSTAAVRRDFEDNLQHMGKTGTILPVFCTASTIYLKYQQVRNPDGISIKRIQGFPDDLTTEIPQLRDWIQKLSVPSRERRAQMMLDKIELLLGSMKPWVDDRSGDLKMSLPERQESELIMKARVEEFRQTISDLERNTTDTMTQLVESEIYGDLRPIERAAATSSLKAVQQWGKMPWNTHKAINQRRGEWIEVRKDKNHIWNDSLAQDYKHNLSPAWNRIFNERLSEEMAAYVTEAKQRTIDFAKRITNLEILSRFPIPLDLLKEQLLKTSNLLPAQSYKVTEAIETKAREIHRDAASDIKAYLTPMYDQCAAERGDGHYKRNRATHEAQMRKYGVQMHHTVSESLRRNLGKLTRDLPMLFSEGSGSFIKQIIREIDLFLEHNSTNGARAGSRKVVSLEKIKLQDSLHASIDNLIKAWSQDITFKAEDTNNLDDVKFEADNRFGIGGGFHDDDENDEDYEL